MKNLMAIVALLCGTAGVYAAENQLAWCSIDPDGEVTVSKGIAEVVVDGAKMANPSVIFATVEADGDIIRIAIFEDRVFWPCDNSAE
jgi:hypothetical protein